MSPHSTSHTPRPGRGRAAPFLAVLLAVGLFATSCSIGSSDATKGSTSASTEGDDAPRLFDPSLVHEISVDYDEADYAAMIESFTESGEKDWIEVTATVDGVTYERAGLRLKGNSSLMGLRTGSPDRAEEGSGSTTTVEGGDPTATPAPPGPGPGGFGGIGGGADAETPEKLPWLIRLDEFVDGQLHQGHADIVVRSNNSTTSLNEAVALDLLDGASLASQQAISTSFSVNGGDPVLRLAIEHPDDDAWQDRSFSSPGALYKAESTGDWTYRGDDPEAYAEVFDQEGGKKVADLTPLIDFLQFINEADDDTFVAELPDRLDVDAFATYLAMMDLTENFDDIDGPGNNAYLWWDEESGRFTVVPWDMNLAFGAMGGGMPGGGGPPEGFDPGDVPEGGPPEGFDPGDLPGGGPPAGFDPGAMPAPGQAPGGDRGGRGGMFGGNNILVTRFHDDASFEALYQGKLDDLRADLFESDTATSLLDDRASLLESVPDLVDAATVQEEAEVLRTQFDATAADGD